jgi:5-methylcytosine-specific restriction endonuclease McrA
MRNLSDVLAAYPKDELGRSRVPKRMFLKLVRCGFFLEVTDTGFVFNNWKRIESTMVIAHAIVKYGEPVTPEQFKAISDVITEGRKLLKDIRKTLKEVGNCPPRYTPRQPKRPKQSIKIGGRRKWIGDMARFIERVLWLKTRGRCFYCKRPVSFSLQNEQIKWAIKEHYFPLSRGGKDDHSNLVPSCPDCDTLKGNKPPEMFIQAMFGESLSSNNKATALQSGK